MYKTFHEREFKKSLSYLARAFSDQLEQGEDYMLAKKVISINLMEENYHLNNFQILNNYGFVNKFNYGRMKDEYEICSGFFVLFCLEIGIFVLLEAFLFFHFLICG